MTDQTAQPNMSSTEAVGSEDQASHTGHTTTTDAGNEPGKTTSSLSEAESVQNPGKDQVVKKGHAESASSGNDGPDSSRGSTVHIELSSGDGTISDGIKGLAIEVVDEATDVTSPERATSSQMSGNTHSIKHHVDNSANQTVVQGVEQAKKETDVAKNQADTDKEADFQTAIDKVKPKIDNDPSSITKEDAALLHSRETRAHGATRKGGITAEAQRLAADNEKAKEA